jgi:hypothetical protein
MWMTNGNRLTIIVVSTMRIKVPARRKAVSFDIMELMKHGLAIDLPQQKK